MIINNTIDSSISITLNLKFDDGTSKEQVLVKGTRLELSYYKDNHLYIKKGIVKDIGIVDRIYASDDYDRHIALRSNNFHCYDMSHKNEASEHDYAILVMDFSEDYNSDIVKVPTCNIVDFKLLQTPVKMELQNMYDASLTINNDEGQYTEERYKTFEFIMNLVKMSLDKPYTFTEQDECDRLVDLLNSAIMLLEPIPEDSDLEELPDEDDTNQETPSDDNTEEAPNDTPSDTVDGGNSDNTSFTEPEHGTETDITKPENSTSENSDDKKDDQLESVDDTNAESGDING